MPIGHLSGRFQRALPPLPQSRLCLRGLEVIPRSKYQKGALVSRSFLLCPLIDSLCPHRKGNGISGEPKTAQGHTVIRGRARRAPSILEPSKLLSPGQVLQNPLNGRERERTSGWPALWLALAAVVWGLGVGVHPGRHGPWAVTVREGVPKALSGTSCCCLCPVWGPWLRARFSPGAQEVAGGEGMALTDNKRRLVAIYCRAVSSD